jgi:hypothetical protein
MEFVTYIDGIVYDNPQGWEGIDTVLKREREFDGILAYYDATVTFYGAAYEYLLDLKNQGFCNKAEMIVIRTDGYTPKKVAQGTIFVADCEFRAAFKSVLCKIKDSTFYAKINSNKGIKTVPSGNLSKAGDTITAAQAYDVLMYALDGTTPIKTIYSIRVYEAFRWFVSFMTNDTISFRSDSFDYGGEYEGLAITCGAKLSAPLISVYNTSNPPLPAFSFEQLYKEVKKKIPICFVIENPFTDPVFRLETIDYLDGNISSVQFTDLDDILTKFDTQRLYSDIKVGSTTVNNSTFLAFPEGINFAGFKQEEFFTVGECSIKNTLDLVSDWIISSNIIEAALGGDTDYNSDLILLDTIVTDPSVHDGRSTNTDFLDVGIFYYNALLANFNTLNRNNGGFPSSIAVNSNDGVSGTFQAIPSATVSFSGGISLQNVFNAETYDNGGNYNTASQRFTAPSTNVYKFEAQEVYRINTLVAPPFGVKSINVILLINVYNALNVLTQTNRLDLQSVFTTGLYTITGNKAIIMNQGDYAECIIEFRPSFYSTYTAQILVPNTYFRSDSNGNTSGIINTVDSDDYAVEIHEFSSPLTSDEFDTMLDNPIDSFIFWHNDKLIRAGQLEEAKYNYATSIGSFKIVTKKSNQNEF